MPPPHGDSCRTIAPLLARHSDPDLSEVERVRLSTHLLRCPRCLARLRFYRTQDQRLRALPTVAASPELRRAVLAAIAEAPAGEGGRGGGVTWLQGLTSVTVAAFALLLFASLVAVPGLLDGERGAVGGEGGEAGELLTGSLTASLLTADPTRVIARATAPAGNARPAPAGAAGPRPAPVIVGASYGVQAYAPASPTVGAEIAYEAQPVTLTGMVVAVYPALNQVVIRLQSTGREETLILADEPTIFLPSGGRGTLADLDAGSLIRAGGDRAATGAVTVDLIVASR